MTHDDDARVADLLARLGDGDSKELFRRLLEAGMQELIDAELTAAIGAAPHERTDSRTNQRNGSRSRLLSTPAGDVELRIPKVRVGSFFPSLLEPRRRVDKALWGVIMTAYTTGTSTRKVDDLVQALGCGSGVSKSTVSRICAGIDEEVAVFRARQLDHVEFPYLYLDATYIKARINHRIISRAVVVATGVTANGDREVLGVDVGDSEDEVFWTAFLRGLKDRRLAGVRLVISDAHAGLKASIPRVLAGASWQRSSVNMPAAGWSRWSPPPPGEDLGSVTGKVQRQTCPSRRWRTLTGQWESCFEHLDERPVGSATRVTDLKGHQGSERQRRMARVRGHRLGWLASSALCRRRQRQAPISAAGDP